jgi:hypothetical protein
MKHVAKITLTEMSGRLADEHLDRVCGGFNPQPDPPVAIQGWDWRPAPRSVLQTDFAVGR